MTRVGLLKVFKEVERNATPGPAPVTPRRARKPRSHRGRLQGPANRHDPRKHARAQSEPTSVATPNRKHTKRQEEQIKCPSTWSAWRLCADGGRRLSRARRLAPAASAGLGDGGRGAHQEMGRGRVRQGERPIRRRSWTQTPWHEEPRKPGQRAQRVQKHQREVATRRKRHEERERRVRAAAGEAGPVGNSWWPSPVTSPDSARATEPRRPEATLELRRGARGARLGSGAGERERVRVRGEAALRDAERNKEAATSWLGEGAAADTAAAAGTAGARGEPASGGTAARPGLAGPMTLERPTAIESSSAGQHRELGRKLAKLITAGHEAAESTNRQRERARNALWAKSNESCKCNGQRSAETQPLGHQNGKPP